MQQIARDVRLDERRVQGIIERLQSGDSIYYLDRYGREEVGNLGEECIRRVREQWVYYENLAERKAALVRDLASKEKLNSDLRQEIEACWSVVELEDIQRLCEPAEGSKGARARERGLGSLAMMIWMQRNGRRDIDALAAKLADPEHEIADAAAALDGALRILAEQMEQDLEVRKHLRACFWKEGVGMSRVVAGKEGLAGKFKPYFDLQERLGEIPPHRLMAIRRGEAEGVIQFEVEIDNHRFLEYLRRKVIHTSDPEIVELIERALEDARDRLLLPEVGRQVREELWRSAEEDAIEVFARNLRKVLLSPPARGLRVLGADPIHRGGVKLAAVDGAGRFLEAATLHFGHSEKRKTAGVERVKSLVRRHRIDVVCIGNGPHAREIEILVREALRQVTDRQVVQTLVNKTGVQLYATSDLGQEELPDLDVAARAAVSIARRFQDPLSELSKVDPKSIGVGQYQQEVSAERLSARLEEVLVSCIHEVGVNLNAAPLSLMSRVSGLSPSLAAALIARRKDKGPWTSRSEVALMPDLPPQSWERAAGFLVIPDGVEPLDRTRVHPSRYELVREMAACAGKTVLELMEDPAHLEKIPWEKFLSGNVGKATLRVIREELRRGGRDARGVLDPASLVSEPPAEGELREGMVVRGTVTNVTNFGAFIDLGMQREGLVHVSQLSKKFVSDPSVVVSVGDRVTVKVLKVDAARNRISLSMKQVGRRDRVTPPESRAAMSGESAAAAFAPAPMTGDGSQAPSGPGTSVPAASPVASGVAAADAAPGGAAAASAILAPAAAMESAAVSSESRAVRADGPTTSAVVGAASSAMAREGHPGGPGPGDGGPVEIVASGDGPAAQRRADTPSLAARSEGKSHEDHAH